jgi:hypothetical protein
MRQYAGLTLCYALLGSLDEDFLPDVDLDHGNLNYTVVIGEVLGNFEAAKKP